MEKLGKALTWDDLANAYDKVNKGRPARTLTMTTVFEWAERQTSKFKVTKDGSVHKILGEVDNDRKT